MYSESRSVQVSFIDLPLSIRNRQSAIRNHPRCFLNAIRA
jgi:hypothetical protein